MIGNMDGRRGGYAAALILIGIGVFFLLTENHVIEAQELWRFWPLILVAVGVTRMTARGPSSRFAGALLIMLGLIFETAEFGWFGLRWHTMWPLMLIGLGLLMLWRNLTPRRYGRITIPTDPDGLDHLTIFGGGERRIGGADFEAATVLAIFGGYKLDLRKAAMKSDKAVVDASAIFGGVEILVPESWNVVVRGAGIFGGYGDESHHPGPGSPAPQLFVEGVAIFGGVAIKN